MFSLALLAALVIIVPEFTHRGNVGTLRHFNFGELNKHLGTNAWPNNKLQLFTELLNPRQRHGSKTNRSCCTDEIELHRVELIHDSFGTPRITTLPGH